MIAFLERLPAVLALGWLDVVAVALFAALWFGYGWYADYSATPRPRLGMEFARYTREWYERMIERDNRMIDVNILRTLTRSSQFFASTTMLILGALVALLGYAETAARLVAQLPFTQQVSQRLWEIKILVLLLIFVYGFFKFSWAIRQYGFASVLVGAAAKGPADAAMHGPHVERLAVITGFANRNFNQGLRAYYFGVAALAWFLHPVLMIAVTLGVVYVLHQREFRSRTLEVLRNK
ncbi:MAG: DUF599 domain-containing protein [Burkholderiales bacterium]|nr:DUF599 domain-containing protein [Burkholderiales bacterium]